MGVWKALHKMINGKNLSRHSVLTKELDARLNGEEFEEDAPEVYEGESQGDSRGDCNLTYTSIAPDRERYIVHGQRLLIN